VGFARANNQAMAQATGEFVFLLNPDTRLRSDTVAQLVGFLRARPEYAIVGAQLLNADGTEQESWGQYPSLRAELPLVNRLRKEPRSQHVTPAGSRSIPYMEVPWVSGAALMLRRALYGEIGGFDEAFWLYTEETDYCRRARELGYHVALLPDARVWHLRRGASRQRMLVSMLWYYQSRVRFVAKHQGQLAGWAVKTVLRLKAVTWKQRPEASPLRIAYPNAETREVVGAYAVLVMELAAPLPGYLSRRW